MVKAVEATRRTVNAIRWAHEERIKANSRPEQIISSGGGSKSTIQVGYNVGQQAGSLLRTTSYSGQFLVVDRGDGTTEVVDGSDADSLYCGICYVGNEIIEVPKQTFASTEEIILYIYEEGDGYAVSFNTVPFAFRGYVYIYRPTATYKQNWIGGSIDFNQQILGGYSG